jgi:hypothetical protein
MMAFDVFPRFLKSKHMTVVMQRLRESGNSNGADQVQSAVNENKNMLPKVRARSTLRPTHAPF